MQIKNLMAMESQLQSDINHANTVARKALSLSKAAEEHIKKATTIDVDYYQHPQASNTIITIGRYHGKSYIRSHDVPGDEFNKLIDIVRDMSKFANLRHCDVPPGMEFKI